MARVRADAGLAPVGSTELTAGALIVLGYDAEAEQVRAGAFWQDGIAHRCLASVSKAVKL
jgi:hypothetical protein